jgi:hypothetical protein
LEGEICTATATVLAVLWLLLLGAGIDEQEERKKVVDIKAKSARIVSTLAIWRPWWMKRITALRPVLPNMRHILETKWGACVRAMCAL